MRTCVFLAMALTLSGCKVIDTDSPDSKGCGDGEIDLYGACLTAEQQQRIGLQCDLTVVTGSRLPVKQCTTKAQRAATKEAARNMVDRMQQQGQGADSQ